MPGQGMQTRLLPGQSLALQQVLSPQLQQSLLVLQTPLLELRNLVQQEMETNPVLEELPDEPGPDSQDEGESSGDDNFANEFEKLASLDEEWRDYMAQSASSGADGFRSSGEAKDKRQFFFDSIAVQETLQQNLLGQLNQTALNASDRKAAELIVGNIDDKGFLQSAPEEMALNSGIPQEDFEKMLALIQGFHPPGVGARDLRECLLIQLRREGKENSLEYKIVSEHMEDLGRRRFPEIARRMGISVEDVQKAADNIGRLNPRPGQVFAAAPQNYVLPDVTVEKVDGEYQITLNDEQIPHLRISNLYKDIIASGNTQSGEVKDYIRDKIRSGKFLIRSIHQRQQTIANIAQQIVARQRDFLEHGPSHLKPMTMKEVADAVGVHETTVSRAVSGKYMATPQGIFEMKYFFTPGYQTAGGESLSNTSVKEAILDLVKREDGNQPLSDNEIVEILSERGIPIARRTVAKYRSELNILPSHMRRKY
ncbi:MAG: RNA polymerase sigma-54 factor [Verrucomicrobia bacterium 13_1_20CM_54_28]|nr:MAG: RNA polymerase sigma-54 factor [Verrucomicrobia bacterium 13_1_20CM_54_28]PYK14116.1 MAG: RNA polymerase sigma-54 factor [Verrucomicrobiota bacterium]